VRPVLSCGGLRFVRRWSAVVCGFQTYPFHSSLENCQPVSLDPTPHFAYVYWSIDSIQWTVSCSFHPARVLYLFVLYFQTLLGKEMMMTSMLNLITTVAVCLEVLRLALSVKVKVTVDGDQGKKIQSHVILQYLRMLI